MRSGILPSKAKRFSKAAARTTASTHPQDSIGVGEPLALLAPLRIARTGKGAPASLKLRSVACGLLALLASRALAEDFFPIQEAFKDWKTSDPFRALEVSIFGLLLGTPCAAVAALLQGRSWKEGFSGAGRFLLSTTGGALCSSLLAHALVQSANLSNFWALTGGALAGLSGALLLGWAWRTIHRRIRVKQPPEPGAALPPTSPLDQGTA